MTRTPLIYQAYVRQFDYAFFLADKEAGEGYFQIDLSSVKGRQVLSFDAQSVVAARATAKRLALLRLENDAEGNQVVFEGWSLGERTRIERRTLTILPALKAGEKVKVANVVWNDDLTLVAFSVKTEYPVPNKPSAVGISNETFVYGLDNPGDVDITNVAHYLMKPIGFSDDSKSLLLFGRYFDERWLKGIGTLDLSTEEFTAVADSDRSRSAPPRISPGGRYAVYEPVGTRESSIQLLSLASGKRTLVTPVLPADHITRPWRIAAAISEPHDKLAIATESTLDLYDIATGDLEARQSLLNEQGRQEVEPLLLEVGPNQVVYAGLSTKLPYETQTLWVQTMPIR